MIYKYNSLIIMQERVQEHCCYILMSVRVAQICSKTVRVLASFGIE
jgi:hypothetical protein